MPTGHIVFVRDGRLLAVPFDRDALEVRGAPFPVLDDIVTSDGWGTAQYAFSDQGNPDGNRIALSVLGANANLWTYDIVRRTMTRLTDAWDNTSPVWSPDGERIACISSSPPEGTWVMAADGAGEPVRLGDTFMDGAPNSWSSDGERFLIVGRSGQSGGDGGAPESRSPIITQAGHRRVFPAVDPDIHVVTGWFSEFER